MSNELDRIYLLESNNAKFTRTIHTICLHRGEIDQLREKLLRHFLYSPNYSSAENAHGARVLAITRDFLCRTDVSTEIGTESLLEKFKEARIPNEPVNVNQYLDYLTENVIAHSVHTASPRFIGHMTSALPSDEGIRKTQYMADSIRAHQEFELLIEPETNILVYRYIPKRWRERAARRQLAVSDNQQINLFNERLQKVQRHAGHNFVSRTTLDNTCYAKETPIVALRAVIANPLTTELDIDAVLDDQLALAESLNAQ